MDSTDWGIEDPVPGFPLQGWLFVQGCWAWGKVLTWHVQRSHDDLHWVTVLWSYTGVTIAPWGQKGWSISMEGMTPVKKDEVIEPWMIHEQPTMEPT